MSRTPPALGPTLRELRQSRGLSLLKLSHRMDASPSHFSRVEKGQVEPTVRVLARIADALQLTAEGRRRVIVAAGFSLDVEASG